MVHIEKLVCKGFKSFGRDSVSIKLNRGFTCIVGPNGSGKSNVIDAILFVLGQLSAKTLRATVFSDLLYSPPKAGMPAKAKSAVVELHFKNKDRQLQVDADKVVIERELDESGKSVCRVNGKVVTRSTVLEILGGIGVDPNGYNLVLQGEIAQMVKVNPVDRRKLIEEIAGISAYDEQKEKALKKLAESETNLGKVDMQLQERRRQLDKLEEERGDALRFTSVKEEIQRIKIDSIAWTVTKSRNRIQTINVTLAERAEEVEKLGREFAEVEEKLDNTEAEIEDIDSEIDRITGGDSARISEQYGIASAAVSHVESSLNRARTDLENAMQEKSSIEEEFALIQDQISSAKSEIKDKELEQSDIEKEIESCTNKLTKLEEYLEKSQSDYIVTTRRLQELNTQMVALDEGVSEVRSAIKSGAKELGMAYEEIQDSESGLEKTEQELSELREQIPTQKQELEISEKSEASKRKEIEELDERMNTVDAEVRESAKLVSDTRDELIRIQARHDALKDAEEAFLKRRRAHARILQLRDTGEVEGIYGTVAELGEIDPNYSVSLEIAGGNRLTHIVVEDDDVATQCIHILKRERVGRASFIPLSKIKARGPGNIPDDERIIGFAIDLVKFDQKYLPAFEFVFSDTIVTEDFESAKKYGFGRRRAVSLEGDLVEKSGLVTGGHYHRGATGLSLKVEDKSPEVAKRLVGLEEILAKIRSKQDDLREEKKLLEKEIQELSKTNYRSNLELEGLEEKFTEKEVRATGLKERIETAKKTIEFQEAQNVELKERDAELTEHRETVRGLRDATNEDLVKTDASKVTQEIKDLKEISEHEKKKREALTIDLTGLRVAVEERLAPKSQELEIRRNTVTSVLPGLEEELKRLESEYAVKDSELDKLRTDRAKIDEAVKDKRTRQVRLKEDMRNLRLRHEEIREAQTGNEKSVYRLQTEQARLENEGVAFTAELGTLANTEEELQKRAQLEEPTYKDLEKLEEKIRELGREQEAMGAVNLKSLEDYEIEKGKYEEIVDKKTHLELEHKEIVAFMKELEAEKTRKFLDVYNQIADNFAKVFAKLSPGGEATLMLENPESPLLGGITVRSKPRGKDLVSLDAMSGGEKTITGLALIFAIQMHSPASFYVFDEIDAALDDVNAHNVATLIAEMSRSSQFVVVSLRDTTVRKADLLVGVSNQDGISKIVSVNLEEVGETA